MLFKRDSFPFWSKKGTFRREKKGLASLIQWKEGQKENSVRDTVSQLVSEHVQFYISLCEIPYLLLFCRNILPRVSSTVLMLIRTDDAVISTRERKNYVYDGLI